MLIKAKAKYLRISPRKARLVADLVRGKKINEAQDILRFTIKKTADPLLKLLESAISNAKNNLEINTENLYISKITVDEGPKYKRWMPRSRGQAFSIHKKTSHINLTLEPIEGKVEKLKEKEEAKKEKKEKIKKPRTHKKDFKDENIKRPGGKEIKKIFRRKAI